MFHCGITLIIFKLLLIILIITVLEGYAGLLWGTFEDMNTPMGIENY